MGESIETRVVFQKIERGILTYLDQGGDEQDDHLTHKAEKALRGASTGDVVEVVWNYDSSRYDIVWAQRITGTPVGDVEILQARVEKLEQTVKLLISGLTSVNSPDLLAKIVRRLSKLDG